MTRYFVFQCTIDRVSVHDYSCLSARYERVSEQNPVSRHTIPRQPLIFVSQSTIDRVSVHDNLLVQANSRVSEHDRPRLKPRPSDTAVWLRMNHIAQPSMRGSRILGAKKIIDRTNEAGIESQCHQLLVPARSYQACSSQKNRLTRSVFLCPKSQHSSKVPASTSPYRSGKFNHLKATTRSGILATEIFRARRSRPRENDCMSAIMEACQ